MFDYLRLKTLTYRKNLNTSNIVKENIFKFEQGICVKTHLRKQKKQITKCYKKTMTALINPIF